MPSTHRLRLSDILKVLGARPSTNLHNLEEHQVGVRISISASTNNINLYCSNGPSAVQRIAFIPETAVTSADGTEWNLEFFHDVAAAGTETSKGTFSTYSSDTKTINSALVAKVRELVYNPTKEFVMKDGESLHVDCTKVGSPSNLEGLFLVYFIPLVD